ncbi:MAG: sulfatase-like hydrolase/transferase, partial [Candidatus Lokiarchaeota archaeon]|nr:sulfatase-like hydrolase/transferase [Candidatus Lokiarchaeota archaeon]
IMQVLEKNSEEKSKKSIKKQLKTRPNILIIMPDEMRGDIINNPHLNIPNIESIASDEGTMFTNAFSVNPVCGPSRCCNFTGQFVHNGGHRSLYQLLRPHEENLFHILKKHGYEVVCIGKNDLFNKKSAKKSSNKRIKLISSLVLKILFNLSFKEKIKILVEVFKVFILRNVNFEDSKIKDIITHYFKMNPYPIGHRLKKSFYFGKRTKQQASLDPDHFITKKALKYLSKQKPSKRKQFCLFLCYNFPHPPYTVEEPYFSMYDRKKLPELIPSKFDDKPQFMRILNNRYNLNKLTKEDFREIRATYYGMVTSLDHQVGLVLNKLKGMGIYDDTAIFFISDHGDYAGDYGLTEKWVTDMRDCLLRVPLLIKLPNSNSEMKNGSNLNIADNLVQSIDIFSTILNIADIQTDYTHFSKDLLPLMSGKVKKLREAVFAEGGYDEREPQCFENKIKSPKMPFMGIYYDKTNLQHEIPSMVARTVMIRTKEWKLILRNTEKNQNELYHLTEDPEELVNLYNNPDYSAKRRELKDGLLAWYLKTSDNPHWEHERLV